MTLFSYICCFLFAEQIAPAIVAAQEQFKFTHILAGADAFGKVRKFDLDLHVFDRLGG